MNASTKNKPSDPVKSLQKMFVDVTVRKTLIPDEGKVNSIIKRKNKTLKRPLKIGYMYVRYENYSSLACNYNFTGFHVFFRARVIIKLIFFVNSVYWGLMRISYQIGYSS